MIICDTGPLVAVLNANDKDHQRCTSFLEAHPGPLLVPSPIVTEVCYLTETRVGPGAEAAFLLSPPGNSNSPNSPGRTCPGWPN